MRKPINDFFKRLKQLVAKPVKAKPSPDLLNRVHFRSIGRQGNNLDIIGEFKAFCRMPCRSIRHKNNIIFRILRRQFVKKDIHTNRITVRQNEKKRITSMGINSSICIAVFTNMVTRHTWPNPFATPAKSGLVDASEARLILKHQTNFTYPQAVDNFV